MRAVIQVLSQLLFIGASLQFVSAGGATVDPKAQARAEGIDSYSESTGSDYERVRHVLDRVTFGATPSLVQQVAKSGLEVYLEKQLDYESIPDENVRSKLELLDTLDLDSKTLVRAYYDRIKSFLSTQQMSRNMPEEARIRYGLDRLTTDQETAETEPVTVAEQVEFLMDRIDYRAIGELQNAKIIRAVHSERQLYEVMVDFWSNHFNIDVRKAAAGPLKIVDDREVVRRHALGNFKDLLSASAHSPAMLAYLDNNENSVRRKLGWVEKRIRSFAIGYLVGVDAESVNANGDSDGMIGGLNENYGRELLELHTLGVDGGYTQNDVIDVSRAFTGWGYSPLNGSFSFNERNHDKGSKSVLGVELNSGRIEDGEQVLDIIALHPKTATHLAYKLCQRFVNDNPPKVLVENVAAAFLESKGDIKTTLRAVLESEAFFEMENRKSKLKSPFEFAVSSLRLLNAEVQLDAKKAQREMRMTLEGIGTSGMGGNQLGQATRKSVNWRLVEMGQPLFAYPAPTGYPEDSSYWEDPGLAMQRMNFALALARGEIAGIQVEYSMNDLETFIPSNYGTLVDEENEALRLAAVLASPKFQYR